MYITDFGIVKIREGAATMTCAAAEAGTPKYAAPDTLDGSYGSPSDIWSLGILLIELFSKTKAWATIKSRHQMYRKLEACEVPPEIVHTGEFQAIISRCCLPSPQERISATELLKELS